MYFESKIFQKLHCGTKAIVLFVSSYHFMFTKNIYFCDATKKKKKKKKKSFRHCQRKMPNINFKGNTETHKL